MTNRIWTPRRGAYTAGTVLALAVCGIIAGGPRERRIADPEAAKAAAAIVPTDARGLAVYAAAKKARGTRIVISTEGRWMWFIEGRDTILSVPVAVGMGKDFEFAGKKYRFDTPRGTRKVLNKVDNPLWTVPMWHYYEKASDRNLEVVYLKEQDDYMLADSTRIVVQDNQVGRINSYGNFWPFEPGIEVVFDDKIFVPPMNTPQRRVPEALGPHKLDMGEGYLIHGTHDDNKDSIGQAVSHGCIRMNNDDLTILYPMVDVGTPVYIY